MTAMNKLKEAATDMLKWYTCNDGPGTIYGPAHPVTKLRQALKPDWSEAPEWAASLAFKVETNEWCWMAGPGIGGDINFIHREYRLV